MGPLLLALAEALVEHLLNARQLVARHVVLDPGGNQLDVAAREESDEGQSGLLLAVRLSEAQIGQQLKPHESGEAILAGVLVLRHNRAKCVSRAHHCVLMLGEELSQHILVLGQCQSRYNERHDLGVRDDAVQMLGQQLRGCIPGEQLLVPELDHPVGDTGIPVVVADEVTIRTEEGFEAMNHDVGVDLIS